MKLASALLFLLSLPALSLPAVAGFYRWVDAQGKVHYSDQPAPAGAKQAAEQKFRNGAVDQPAALPKASVTLFTTVACGAPCDTAKTFLAKRNIKFSSKDPATDVAANELLRTNGGTPRVPTLMIDGDKIEGFNESSWNYALNKAGFAKAPAEKAPAPDAGKTSAPAPSK